MHCWSVAVPGHQGHVRSGPMASLLHSKLRRLITVNRGRARPGPHEPPIFDVVVPTARVVAREKSDAHAIAWIGDEYGKAPQRITRRRHTMVAPGARVVERMDI